MTRHWSARLALAGAFIHVGIAGAAAGGSNTHSIRVKNNSGYTTVTQAFNNNDTARMIPASEVNIDKSAQKAVTCNTAGSCYLKADYTNNSGRRISDLIGRSSTCVDLYGSGDYIYHQVC